MGKQDNIISILDDEINDEKIIQEVISKHEKSGKSILKILQGNNILNEELFTKIIAAT